MKQRVEDKLVDHLSNSIASFMEGNDVGYASIIGCLELVKGEVANWMKTHGQGRECDNCGGELFPWEVSFCLDCIKGDDEEEQEPFPWDHFRTDFIKGQEEEEQETEMSHDLAIRLLKMPNLPVGFPSVKEWNYDDAKIYRVEVTEVEGRDTSTGEDTKVIILGPELHES